MALRYFNINVKTIVYFTSLIYLNNISIALSLFDPPRLRLYEGTNGIPLEDT